MRRSKAEIAHIMDEECAKGEEEVSGRGKKGERESLEGLLSQDVMRDGRSQHLARWPVELNHRPI